MQQQAKALAKATLSAIESSGKRVVLLASNLVVASSFYDGVSHPGRHEPGTVVMHHGQYLWDMHAIDLLRSGKTAQFIDENAGVHLAGHL